MAFALDIATAIAIRISYSQQAKTKGIRKELTRQDQLVTGDRSSDNGLLGRKTLKGDIILQTNRLTRPSRAKHKALPPINRQQGL
jgi:hypothetical protein